MSDYISDCIFYLILKFLPVRTLLRCRCVRKSWKELVDSRSFILDHLAVQIPRLIEQRNTKFYHVFELETLDPPSRNERLHRLPPVLQEFSLLHPNHKAPMYVAGIVDGVICIYDNENLLLLWNPSIRRMLRLRLPKISPVDNFKCCGFWMDPYLNFKIVIIFLVQSKLAIYSSVKKAWMEVAIEPERVLDNSLLWSGDAQILIDGVGHWKLDASGGNHISHGIIGYFDFVQENFGTIEFPNLEELGNVVYSVRLIKWRECVSVAHWQKTAPCGACDLWAMQNGLCSKVFSFNLVGPVSDVLYVGKDFESAVAKSPMSTLLLFDPRDFRMKSYRTLPSRDAIMSKDFVESLVFPYQRCISGECSLYKNSLEYIHLE